MRRYHEWVGHPLVSDRYATLYNPLDPKISKVAVPNGPVRWWSAGIAALTIKSGTPGATKCIQPWLERFPLRGTTSQVRHQRSANLWLNMDWKNRVLPATHP